MTAAAADYDVLIIGAGPAGSAVAVHLARQGRRVLLLEKRSLPGPKLCGAFLSVETTALFARLGALEAVRAAGARAITHTRVTTADGRGFEAALPGTALGLRRETMDLLLFRHAATAGAVVRDGTAVRSVQGSLSDGFTVHTADAVFTARVVLGAYGRRARLDRTLARPFFEAPAPLLAFQATHRPLPGAEALGPWVEVHAFPDGYCGVSSVEEGLVNVCWLAHERALRQAGGDPDAMVRQSLGANPALRDRLAGLERVPARYQAVSRITYARKGLFDGDLCMMGDAAAMIAPFCGDGMGMALHTAELLAPLVGDLLDGHRTPASFRRAYRTAWQRTFGRRLMLGRWIDRGARSPGIAAMAASACRWIPGLAPWLIRQTRSTFLVAEATAEAIGTAGPETVF